VIALGVDQARHSGWAIANGRHALHWGAATTHAHRRAAVELAISVAGGAKHLLVMFEDHTKMPIGRGTRDDKDTRRDGPNFVVRSTASIIGQGKAYGRWLEVLDMLGVPHVHVDDVEPRVWRAKVGVRGKGTDELKREALKVASGYAGAPIVDDDVAEAVCLAVFGSIDGTARNEKRLREARAERKGEAQLSTQQTIDGFLAGLNPRTPEDVLAEMRAMHKGQP
jgi:hypothetical protein